MAAGKSSPKLGEFHEFIDWKNGFNSDAALPYPLPSANRDGAYD